MTNTGSPFDSYVHIEFHVADITVSPIRRAVIALARKVKALADRPGTEAEGESAKAVLDRMVREHGLTARELAEDRPPLSVVVRGRTGPWPDVFRDAPETASARPASKASRKR